MKTNTMDYLKMKILFKINRSRKQAEERIKQLQELEEKEDSSIDINKLVRDFVNMEEEQCLYL